MSSIVTTSVTSTVSQSPARSSVSTTAKPAPPNVQPPQVATPPTSKKEGRHTSVVVVTVIHEHHHSTKSTKSKDRGALLGDIRKGTILVYYLLSYIVYLFS